MGKGQELGKGTGVDEGDRAVSCWPQAQLQGLGNGASEAGYEKYRLPPPLLRWGGEEVACIATTAMEMTWSPSLQNQGEPVIARPF